MHNRFKNILLILFLFIVFVLTTQQTFAGQNIPSKAEVAYAKELYILIADFDDKEATFAQTNTGPVSMNSSKIIAAFENKFNYTKTFYMNVHKIQPSSKFVQSHSELLEGIYANLQYIKLITNGLKKGESINFLTNSNKTTFTVAMNKYQSAVKTFSDIIKSWQKPYIKEVLPPKYLPSTDE